MWGGNEGVVREIRLRVSKLDTINNQLVTEPNSDPVIETAQSAIPEKGAAPEGGFVAPEPVVPVRALGASAGNTQGPLWNDSVESRYGGVWHLLT